MASGGNRKRKDLPNQDPGTFGFSSSFPETGAAKNKQNNNPRTSYSSGNQQGRGGKNPYQRKPGLSTPTSSEKRREDHWKVPSGESDAAPQILFGSDNPQFQFDGNYGRGQHHYGYNHYPNNGGRHYGQGGYGGRNSPHWGGNYHPQRQGANDPRNHNQRQNNRQWHNSKPPHNHGPKQGKSGAQAGNSDPKTGEKQEKGTKEKRQKDSKITEAEKLTVTIGNKSNGKRTVDISSMAHDDPASSSQNKSDETEKPAEKGHNDGSRDKEKDSVDKMAQTTSNMEENKSDEKSEVKKKKRQRMRERKRAKKKSERIDQQDEGSRPSSQASSISNEKTKEKQEGKGKGPTPAPDHDGSNQGTPEKSEEKKQNSRKRKLGNILNIYANPLIGDEIEEVSPVQKEEKKKDKQSETVKESVEKQADQEPSSEEKSEAKTPEENGPKESAKVQTSEKDQKELEELGLKQAEKRLEKDMIFKLEKKSPNFPQAVYFCQLCSHHLNTIALAHKHIKDKRHKKEYKAKQQDELLKRLKPPPKAAMEALERLLESVIAENMMSDEDARERKEVLKRLDEIASTGVPGCNAVMYGSSVSMIGLKSSDVNVDIQFPSTLKTPAVLMSLLNLFEKSDKFKDVVKIFDAKVPRIEMTDVQTNLRCSLSANNIKALNTTRLLRMYGRIEPLVVKLSLLLRYWGHLCHVDRQSEGSLPPHSFILMVIFYLQQKHGLPVLHEIMAEHDIDAILDEMSDDHEQLQLSGDSWWYCPTAPPGDKKSEKNEDVDDDDDIDETADFSDSEEDLGIAFSESPRKEPVLPMEGKGGTAETENISLDPVELPKCSAGNETLSLAELWLDLLKFYSVQFDMENLIITIRSSSRVTRTDRGWSHRRIAVEDPCSTKWNLCKPMNSQLLFSYFMMRLKHSVFYFHTAHNSARNNLKKPENEKKMQKNTEKQNRKGGKEHSKKNKMKDLGAFPETSSELASVIIKSALLDVKGQLSHMAKQDKTEDPMSHMIDNKEVKGQSEVADDDGDSHLPCLDRSDDCEGHMSQMDEQEVKGHVSHMNDSNASSKKPVDISELADLITENIVKSLGFLTLNEKNDKESQVAGKQPSQEQEKEETDKTKVEVEQELNYDLCYKFTKESLTDGKAPVVVCCLCKREGHLKKNCPDEVKVKVDPLPAFTKHLKNMLDAVCMDMYNTFRPKSDEEAMRDQVCNSLLRYLQQHYDPNVEICLFGSSRNRFTFRGSDLDICMTFKGNETGEGLDFAKIIEDLAKVLRHSSEFRQIIPITTAKVPIVKFIHPRSSLEGDISLYNLLAQRNTSMLALYASIDQRCRILGYAMKAFVKRCCIGDASRGSLSSYAYTLLVIYFLQQRDPPVLPVLQELYEGKNSPEVIVDGWNSWFYENIGNLEKVWEDFGKNKESIGELWLGLLRFYTEEFNFRQHVASIRQKEILTAFEKEWTSKCICIEDPFDLNHNLGAGVSRKMTNFIMKVFVKARERFGTDPGNAINNPRDYPNYFFDARFLMDGQEVPNDRCCRICGKIGHFVKDCPKRRNGRGKNKNGDDAKIRDFDCFNCGQKGHYKKDCPENIKKAPPPSPVQNNGIFQASPHKPSPIALLPTPPMHYMFGLPQPMQNRGQSSPVVIQAKRQTSKQGNFDITDPHTNKQSPAERKQEKRNEKQQNWKNNGRQQQSGASNQHTPGSKSNRTPQNNHTRHQQQQRTSTPHSGTPKSAPSPRGGPPQNQAVSSPKPVPVNRNLANDFELGKNLIAERSISESPRRDPVTSNPSTQQSRSTRHGLTLKDARNDPPRGQLPMPTVAEIESQMMNNINPWPESSKVKPPMRSQSSPMMSQYNHHQGSPTIRPQPGDKLNHLIPRQSSNEDFHPSPNGAHPQYGNYGHSPQSHQFPMSPLSPTSPYGGPFMHPTFSTSPRNHPSQFGIPPHSPEVPFFRSPGHGHIARTPPSGPPLIHPNMRSPGNPQMGEMSPRGPQYQLPQNKFNNEGPMLGFHPIFSPLNGDPVNGGTFVNSNEKNKHGAPARVVTFTPTMTQPHDIFRGDPNYPSFPPNNTPPTNKPPNGSMYWSTPSPRK